MRIALVDAFTRTRGAGNRAGVVPDADPLDPDAMARVAAAVGASETAFLLAPPEGAHVSLRYFTPTTEIPFCGHATVASFHWLVEAGKLAVPGRYVLACPDGQFDVDLERDDDGVVQVWLTTPQFDFHPAPIPAEALVELLGTGDDRLDPSLPIERAGPRLYVPFRRRADVWGLAPRYQALAAALEPHEIYGVYVFTRETIEPGSVTHGRYFAPGRGVNEDPVTGSASGPLGTYLARHGVLEAPARGRLEQGDAMGKAGRVALELVGSGDTLERVRIGGAAITVLEGTLTL